MKKKLLFALLLLFALKVDADNVLLKEIDDTDNKQFEVPVHVDIEHSLLSVHLEKADKVFVSVLGPDGIIYQREITLNTAKSIYVDLESYQDGEYTICLQDAKGNALEGEFQKGSR